MYNMILGGYLNYTNIILIWKQKYKKIDLLVYLVLLYL